jgi:hypothetical protein
MSSKLKKALIIFVSAGIGTIITELLVIIAFYFLGFERPTLPISIIYIVFIVVFFLGYNDKGKKKLS